MNAFCHHHCQNEVLSSAPHRKAGKGLGLSVVGRKDGKGVFISALVSLSNNIGQPFSELMSFSLHCAGSSFSHSKKTVIMFKGTPLRQKRSPLLYYFYSKAKMRKQNIQTGHLWHWIKQIDFICTEQVYSLRMLCIYICTGCVRKNLMLYKKAHWTKLILKVVILTHTSMTAVSWLK